MNKEYDKFRGVLIAYFQDRNLLKILDQGSEIMNSNNEDDYYYAVSFDYLYKHLLDVRCSREMLIHILLDLKKNNLADIGFCPDIKHVTFNGGGIWRPFAFTYNYNGLSPIWLSSKTSESSMNWCELITNNNDHKYILDDIDEFNELYDNFFVIDETRSKSKVDIPVTQVL